MAVKGWSFWAAQGTKRIVVYVGNSDRDEALRLGVEEAGDFTVEREVAMDAATLKFIGVGPNEVTVGTVQQ